MVLTHACYEKGFVFLRAPLQFSIFLDNFIRPAYSSFLSRKPSARKNIWKLGVDDEQEETEEEEDEYGMNSRLREFNRAKKNSTDYPTSISCPQRSGGYSRRIYETEGNHRSSKKPSDSAAAKDKGAAVVNDDDGYFEMFHRGSRVGGGDEHHRDSSEDPDGRRRIKRNFSRDSMSSEQHFEMDLGTTK